MSFSRFPSLLCATALLAVPASAEIQLGQQQFFKDWAAACDNMLSCEAVALAPESAPSEGLSLALLREAKSGNVRIRLSGFETKSDRYRIMIDGKFADSGPISKGDVPIEVTGKDAIRLARGLAKGRALALQDGNGTALGTATLSGSAAALHYIDRMQNRRGSADALAAAGRKTKPAKSLDQPVIIAKRIVPDTIIPDAATLIRLAETSACLADRTDVTQDTAYSLGRAADKAQALVLLSCGSGAYNFSSAIYIGTENAPGQWSFAPARFDYNKANGVIGNNVQLVTNADWSATTQTLSSYSKGRGLGDCGNAESYVWDGSLFRLISASGMAQCRGSSEWLTLWSAEARRVD